MSSGMRCASFSMGASARSASNRRSSRAKDRGCACCGPAPSPLHSSATHSAPSTRVTIVPAGEVDAQAAALSQGGKRIAVLAQRLPLKAHKYVTWINAGRRPEQYAQDLYANLRTLDKAACQQILVQDVPHDERWDAVRDRLTRAASQVSDSDDTGALAVLP